MIPEENKVHHQTKRGADIALAKKQISPDSHRAILAGELDLAAAKNLGRNAGPAGPTVRVNKDDRTPTPSECLCGCGELVPRTFKPGHDQRMVTFAKEFVRGERELSDEQREYVEQSGKLDRARARVEAEEAKRREREAKKSSN